MKYVIRTIAISVLVGLVVWAMDFIIHDQSDFKNNGDWGIAKDNPLK